MASRYNSLRGTRRGPTAPQKRGADGGYPPTRSSAEQHRTQGTARHALSDAAKRSLFDCARFTRPHDALA